MNIEAFTLIEYRNAFVTKISYYCMAFMVLYSIYVTINICDKRLYSQDYSLCRDLGKAIFPLFIHLKNYHLKLTSRITCTVQHAWYVMYGIVFMRQYLQQTAVLPIYSTVQLFR